MIRYHDEEWGVPVHDDNRLFEFLILEGAQAGLSWETILNKRENYRAVFDGFDPQRVARYDRRKIAQLLRNPDIVRNRLKIAAAVRNAQALLRVQKEFGTFEGYIWQFVDRARLANRWKSLGRMPCEISGDWSCIWVGPCCSLGSFCADVSHSTNNRRASIG
jgi:DNA-3-methyladenine glycosylase I